MAAGCSFADAQDMTLLLIEPKSLLDIFWKVLPDYWGAAPHPTLTAVGGTWPYGFRFEIKVVAWLPQ